MQWEAHKRAAGSSTGCVTINQLLYGPSQQNGMLSLLTSSPWINNNLNVLLIKNKAFLTWDGWGGGLYRALGCCNMGANGKQMVQQDDAIILSRKG